ncbi:MAG TPA: hypothetical protein VHW65_05000 [Gemmatimonadales bacterium]|jgi:hypothetical protein|nr:hypothetical protein [Gemmatimonadales bacterium]
MKVGRASALLPAMTLLLAGGCRPGHPMWAHRLADAKIARLERHWNLQLTMPALGDSAVLRAVQGHLSLILNRQEMSTAFLAPLPDAFGTYDIAFDSVARGSGPSSGPPDVLAFVVGDSVFLRLAPQADISVVLAGTWRGDSIAGRWYTSDRAGPNALGHFVLRANR